MAKYNFIELYKGQVPKTITQRRALLLSVHLAGIYPAGAHTIVLPNIAKGSIFGDSGGFVRNNSASGQNLTAVSIGLAGEDGTAANPTRYATAISANAQAGAQFAMNSFAQSSPVSDADNASGLAIFFTVASGTIPLDVIIEVPYSDGNND
ncbi:MAG: hypothetical protein LBT53_03345 [Puniceicoccales bacterium]|jgi:hypothetical protein|nr:hypothetical protein [Puniceicoccales bacterium]